MRIANMAVSATNTACFYVNSLTECQQTCMETFHDGCLSVEYNAGSRQCCTQAVSWFAPGFPGNLWIDYPSWDHYCFCPEGNVEQGQSRHEHSL